MAPYLLDRDVKGLRFSYRAGFRCDTLDFLNDLGHLELLSQPSHHPDFDFGPMPLSSLINLERYTAPFKHPYVMDFNQLPILRSCTIQWNKKVNSLFQSNTLRRLQISSLNWQYADEISNLTSLENLEISHSGIRSFAPLRGLSKLKTLSLQVCHGLENLDGIEALQDLRFLNLNEVGRINSLESLAPLKNLEVLTIVDAKEIQSVAPLAALKNLKAVWIGGTRTKITDGDLTPLTKLPKLAMLTLATRRHHSHKVIKQWSWDNLEKPDRQLEPV